MEACGSQLLGLEALHAISQLSWDATSFAVFDICCLLTHATSSKAGHQDLYLGLRMFQWHSFYVCVEASANLHDVLAGTGAQHGGVLPRGRAPAAGPLCQTPRGGPFTHTVRHHDHDITRESHTSIL